MTPDNKAIVYRWFEEVWNQGREATIDELFAQDGVAIGLGESDVEVRGPAQFKTFFHNLRTSFPDIHITIEDTLAEGEKVAVRVKIEGTHLGDGLGVPPTGRRMNVAGIIIIRIAHGRIVEGWNSWDQLGMLRQIGAIPAPSNDRFLTVRG
jgi:steroid delta-isomerase-like uncharacterized protein